jgi:hypothetical protein
MNKKSNVIEFNTPYGKQPPRCFFDTVGETLTQQHFQEETEINNILRSHDRNGIISHIHKGQAIYGDFSDITDLQDALDKLKKANNEFMNVPSEIREKFQNDAGKFYTFASNPDNLDEMVKMGLANKPIESDAMPSETAIPETAEPQNSEVQE